MNTNFIRTQIEQYTGKITPAKALVALAIVYIVVRVLGVILSIFDAVLPFVVLGVIAYFGYQFLQGQSPAAQQIKGTISGVTSSVASRRSSATEAVSQDVIERIITPERKQAPVEAPQVDTVNVLADESAETLVEDAPPAAKLQVAERINPETGLREPDLARLEEREKEKPSQDNVMAQLEERKKRLRGG